MLIISVWRMGISLALESLQHTKDADIPTWWSAIQQDTGIRMAVSGYCSLTGIERDSTC
jgi:hypothetical protein